MILSSKGKRRDLDNLNLDNDAFSDCRQQALDFLLNNPSSAASAIDSFVECAELISASIIQQSMDEVSFNAEARKNLASALENLTCDDDNLETSEAIETKIWSHNDRNITVNILLDRPHSQIHLLENFITEDECKVVEKKARLSGFSQATTFAAQGGLEISKHRKATQASVYTPYIFKYFGSPVALLKEKVLEYTNSVTNYDLDGYWQEQHLVAIKYIGRGEDDPEPDQYLPHCDGKCEGRQFREGSRVATMVMYCQVPEKGGATNFRNSGIHIVPKPGNAVFFSYMGDDEIMDNGFTEHSGCPVIQGNKTIITRWMRKGINSSNQKETLYKIEYV